jgi:hypothetical protein
MLRFVECRNENNSGRTEPVARDWTHRFEPHVSADRRAPWELGREMSGEFVEGAGREALEDCLCHRHSGAACLIAFSSMAVSVSQQPASRLNYRRDFAGTSVPRPSVSGPGSGMRSKG